MGQGRVVDATGGSSAKGINGHHAEEEEESRGVDVDY
jgi:hypothetical protein